MARLAKIAPPAALEYHRYPMWLNHKSLDPVIVYNVDQEAEHKARGYEAPGNADPHGYLVSKVTDKLDDAIRAMNQRVEAKIRDGLRDVYNRVVEIIQGEVKRELRIGGQDYFRDDLTMAATESLAKEFEASSTKLSTDIMSVVRDIANGTRYDG